LPAPRADPAGARELLAAHRARRSHPARGPVGWRQVDAGVAADRPADAGSGRAPPARPRPRDVRYVGLAPAHHRRAAVPRESRAQRQLRLQPAARARVAGQCRAARAGAPAVQRARAGRAGETDAGRTRRDDRRDRLAAVARREEPAVHRPHVASGRRAHHPRRELRLAGSRDHARRRELCPQARAVRGGGEPSMTARLVVLPLAVLVGSCALAPEGLLDSNSPQGWWWPLQIGIPAITPASLLHITAPNPPTKDARAYNTIFNAANVDLTASYQVDVWGNLDARRRVTLEQVEQQR